MEVETEAALGVEVALIPGASSPSSAGGTTIKLATKAIKNVVVTALNKERDLNPGTPPNLSKTLSLREVDRISSKGTTKADKNRKTPRAVRTITASDRSHPW